MDVLAVPFGAYADTTEVNAGSAWYSVAAVVDADTPGESSAPVAPVPADEPGVVQVRVRPEVARPLPRPWRLMIGSEHLSHMLSTDRTGDRVIGEELTEALRIMRDTVGVEYVRAHAILCDDLGVYREVGGSRCTISPASTGSTTACVPWTCGRLSNCPSCRAIWPRTRTRRCSPTARSPHRPRTGIAGPSCP